jgi:hypothetical protein
MAKRGKLSSSASAFVKWRGERREGVMKQWGRRFRAAIGMGLTWAAAWFVAGVLLARVPGFSSDLPFALLFAPLGFVSGVIFSGILVGIEGRRGFDRTSISRFAGWGAASGLVLSGIFVAAAAVRGETRGESSWCLVLPSPSRARCALLVRWPSPDEPRGVHSTVRAGIRPRPHSP